MFVPKNWLSKDTDSLAKRFPVAAVDLENNPQNTIQLLKQTRKQLEELHNAIPNAASLEEQIEAVQSQINGLTANLTELKQKLTNEIADVEISLLKQIRNIIEWIDKKDGEQFLKLETLVASLELYVSALQIVANSDYKGIDFILPSTEEVNEDANDPVPWVPSFNFSGGPVNASDGLNVLNGFAADKGNITELTVSYAGITSLGLGAISDVEECIEELRTDINDINETAIPNLQTQIDGMVKVPAPPDSVNDYALQSIGGALTWALV
jgi:hypothetical protein